MKTAELLKKRVTELEKESEELKEKYKDPTPVDRWDYILEKYLILKEMDKALDIYYDAESYYMENDTYPKDIEFSEEDRDYFYEKAIAFNKEIDLVEEVLEIAKNDLD